MAPRQVMYDDANDFATAADLGYDIPLPPGPPPFGFRRVSDNDGRDGQAEDATVTYLIAVMKIQRNVRARQERRAQELTGATQELTGVATLLQATMRQGEADTEGDPARVAEEKAPEAAETAVDAAERCPGEEAAAAAAPQEVTPAVAARAAKKEAKERATRAAAEAAEVKERTARERFRRRTEMFPPVAGAELFSSLPPPALVGDGEKSVKSVEPSAMVSLPPLPAGGRFHQQGFDGYAASGNNSRRRRHSPAQ